MITLAVREASKSRKGALDIDDASASAETAGAKNAGSVVLVGWHVAIRL